MDDMMIQFSKAARKTHALTPTRSTAQERGRYAKSQAGAR
jgi:hypothetical protein